MKHSLQITYTPPIPHSPSIQAVRNSQNQGTIIGNSHLQTGPDPRTGIGCERFMYAIFRPQDIVAWNDQTPHFIILDYGRNLTHLTRSRYNTVYGRALPKKYVRETFLPVNNPTITGEVFNSGVKLSGLFYRKTIPALLRKNFPSPIRGDSVKPVADITPHILKGETYASIN